MLTGSPNISYITKGDILQRTFPYSDKQIW